MSEAAIRAGLLLTVVGAFSSTPGITLIGLLTLLATFLGTLWSRYGLRRLRYQRHVPERAMWGDEVPLEIIIRNEKPLPLPFVEAADFVTEGLTVKERALTPAEDRPGFGALRNAWSLSWFEQVARRYHIVADRRGIFRFASVRLRVADIFGRDVAAEEHDDLAVLVVRPRMVPLRLVEERVAPPGERKVRQGLHEDPALFSGVRPFQPGDPRRRVHWRASARMGSPVSKRYDPSQARLNCVALDVQTLDVPPWVIDHDPELAEALAVAAGSLARHLLATGAACGFAAAGFTGSISRIAYVAPATGPQQLVRIADTLGRLSPFPSGAFEHLLASLPQRLPPGTTMHVLTGRDATPYLAELRRLTQMGYEVRFLGLGRHAQGSVARARAFGFPARMARLDPDWRTSQVLELAG